MKQNNEQTYLDLYRQYEGLLRERGTEYRNIEEMSGGLKKDRMTIMRQIRNYLVHRGDSDFVKVSDKQLQFLSSLILEEELRGDLLRDHLLSIKKATVTKSESLISAITKMKRLDFYSIVVYDEEKLWGRLDVREAALAIIKDSTATVGAIKKLKPIEKAYAPDIRIEKIEDWRDGVVCVSPKGLLGIGVLK